MKSEDKDALIHELWDKNQELTHQNKALEAELTKYKQRVRKTSKNSSLPPAKGFKKNVESKTTQTSVSKAKHREGGRPLSSNPDQIVMAFAQECRHCGCHLGQHQQQLEAHYDKIELPIIQPVVTQVKRYGGHCPDCGQYYVAPVSAELEQGSPFGESIVAMVSYLRYAHAISYQRMSRLMEEVFGLRISEGAVANLLKRLNQTLQPSVSEILERLRASEQVGSDETSARVMGKTQWEWVFQNQHVCYHVIHPRRAAQVIEEVMGEAQPQVWVSDLFSAQAKHPAQQWQVCLAHQLRDCQFAMDKGDRVFAPVMRQIFLRAIAIHNRRESLSASTLYQYRCQIRRRLKHALSLNPDQDDGLRLLKRYKAIADNLFLFLDDPSIPPTNNASEQALRLSVIFRKVTNGFRSDWGKEVFAAIRSVINTGQRQGLSALESIRRALDPNAPFFSVDEQATPTRLT